MNKKGRRNQEEGQTAAFSKFSDLSPAGSHQVTLIAQPFLAYRTWQLGPWTKSSLMPNLAEEFSVISGLCTCG